MIKADEMYEITQDKTMLKRNKLIKKYEKKIKKAANEGKFYLMFFDKRSIDQITAIEGELEWNGYEVHHSGYYSVNISWRKKEK